MRSAAAIADCMTAYLALKSLIGIKNLLTYSMNATTRPTVTAPSPILLPARQAMAAAEHTPMASTMAYMLASAIIDPV